MTEILKKNNLPWNLIAIFLLFSTIILLVGYLNFDKQRAENRAKDESALSAIADLKVGLIVNWRREREGDAAVTLQNPLFVRRVKQYLDDPLSSDKRQEVLIPMKLLQEKYKYRNIFLLDMKMKTRLWVIDEDTYAGKLLLEAAGKAIQSKKTVFSDFHRDTVKSDIHIEILVPLFMHNDPVGVFLMRIDPRIFLYPLIQSWPTPSPTAESLLIGRDENDIVYLNDLRHRKDAALNLRHPLTDEKLPAAMAARGKEGVVEGLDYRGVPVLAAIKRVPDSPWYLVCKVDREELFAPIRNHAWMIFFLICALIVASSAGIGFIWYNQRVGFYRKLYEVQLEREVLMRHHEYLTKYANDIILMLDKEWRIVEVNDRALQAYGYTRDEMLQMNIGEMRDPENLPDLPVQMEQIERKNGLLFETVHRRKDGTTFPVEVSARTIEIEGAKFYQGIIRDISDRKQAADYQALFIRIMETLNNPNEIINLMRNILLLLKKHTGMEAIGIRLREEEDFPYYESNGFPPHFLDAERYLCVRDEKNEIIRDSQGKPYLECMCGNIISGRTDPALPFFTEGGSFWTNSTTKLLASTSEEDRQTRTRNRCNSEGYESVALIPLKSGEEMIGLLQLNDKRSDRFTLKMIQFYEGIGASIGIAIKRMRMEEALKEGLEKYQRFFMTSGDCIFITSKDGRWIDMNDAAVELFGYSSREELMQVKIQNLYANPEDRIKHNSVIEEQGFSKEFPVDLLKNDGTVMHTIITAVALCDAEKDVIGFQGTIRDITKRRQQEEEREKMLLWQQGVNLLQQSLLAPATLEEKLRAITDSIVSLFDADFSRIWLIQPGDLCEQGCVHADVDEEPHICRYRDRCLHLLASSGSYTHTDGTIHRRVPFGCYKIGRIASDDDHRLLTNDVQNDPRIHNPEWAREHGLVSFVGYQLRVPGGKTLGVLALFAKHPILSSEDAILDGLSSAVALVIQREVAEKSLRQTLESLHKAIKTTIQVMGSAVETRDPYTAGHQIRSAELARSIATEMGLPKEEIDGIRMAGSIHDIGKLSIPAEILSKPTKLTEVEFLLIKEHSRSGYEILKDVESSWPLAEMVYQHHERMDGSGYPRNLKGDEILMGARILSVSDVVESMASHRPYRPALGIEAALEEIEKNRGTHYDNTVADACLRLFREKGYQLERTSF